MYIACARARNVILSQCKHLMWSYEELHVRARQNYGSFIIIYDVRCDPINSDISLLERWSGFVYVPNTFTQLSATKRKHTSALVTDVTSALVNFCLLKSLP